MRKEIKDRPALLKDIVKVMCEKRKGLTEEDAYDLYKCVINWVKQEVKSGEASKINFPNLGYIYTKIPKQSEKAIYNKYAPFKSEMVRFQRMMEEDLEERNVQGRTIYKLTSATYLDSVMERFNKNIYDIETLQNNI